MSAARLAIIGTGVIGKRHIAAINSTSAAELVAIADPSPSARETAALAGVPHFQEAEEMLAASSPEGVIIATPTAHHQAPTLSALDAGVHVLVEKPIAATNEEAAQIVAKSEHTGRHVLVGHHRRYYLQVQRAREIVQGGELGRLVAISGQWAVRKHEDYFSPDWRKKREAGPVLTNLIHEMDSLRYICGEVSSVSAETSNAVLNLEKEDAAALVMRFDSGALGTFILSDQVSSPWAWEFATGENPAFPRSAQNAVRFMGTKASLDFPNLTLWRHNDCPGNWNQDINPKEEVLKLGDAFVRQIEHFCAVIKGEQQPKITASDGSKTLRATLAVFAAARDGMRVVL